MPATNRHINVKTATWQPGGTGSVTTLSGLKNANYKEQVQVIKESADGDLFMSVAAAVGYDPQISMDMIDAFQLYATPGGLKGTLEITIPDAYNGVTASGGGYKITMTNAMIEDRGQQHGHRKYSTQGITFGSVSPDGVTHPVSITPL